MVGVVFVLLYSGPPSAPINLTISDVTNTTAFLEWGAALDAGNRTDLFYTISTNVTGTVYNTTDTSFELDTLIPFVMYEISVTADNGVSSQDEDGRASRTLSVLASTDEGGMIFRRVCILGLILMTAEQYVSCDCHGWVWFLCP